ncbi:MAG TPA: YncE family protein, partial [Candidatus Kapabacteria bacterium]|nr:YncE family protein [Candidatus Kapabacteria bacterium]
GSTFENDIIPYAAVWSHLFQHINTNPNLAAEATPLMPLSRNPLSISDQKTIFDWINQGAPSENGAIPYMTVKQKIFVVNEGDDRVTILDDSTHRIVRMTSVGVSANPLSPSCLAMTPDKQSFILGAVNSNGTVCKYNASDCSAMTQFNSGYYINDLAVTPDGMKGYITDYPPSVIQRFGIFDASAMKMMKSVSYPGFSGSFGIAITHDGKYAYISGASSDNVVKVDTKMDSVIAIFRVGSDVPMPVPDGYVPKYLPGYMTISPDDKYLYLGCRNSSELLTIATANDSIINRTPLTYTPFRSALSPDGSELWITAWGSNEVKVMNTSSYVVTATIDSINTNPRAIAFSADGSVAYVACEKLVGGLHNHGLNGGAPPSGIYVIDRRSKTILYTFAAPGFSTSIGTSF